MRAMRCLAVCLTVTGLLALSNGMAKSVQLVFPGALPTHKIETIDSNRIAITLDAATKYEISAVDSLYEVRNAGTSTQIVIPVEKGWTITTSSDKSTLTVGAASTAVSADTPKPAAVAAVPSVAAEKSAAVPAIAVDSQSKKVADIIQNYSLDLSIPDSPGLAIVGLSTEDVAHPSTPRALAAAIQSGMDKNGQPKTGVAVDFAPFKLAAPATSTEAYRNSRFTRALWNTQVSLGTAKPTDSSDKSLFAGIGIHSILFRRESTDPLLSPDHLACLDKVLAASEAKAKFDPTKLGGGGATFDADASKAAGDCYKRLADATWNATMVAASLATSRFSETGQWGDGKQAAHGGWMTMSYGFEELGPDSALRQKAQAIVTYRRLLKERVTDPLDSSAFVMQGSSLVGAQLRWRGDDRHYFMEYSYQRIDIPGRESDKVRRLSVGFDWKLADGVWLVAALGGEGGRKNGTDNSFVTTGLKFGSASESLLSNK